MLGNTFNATSTNLCNRYVCIQLLLNTQNLPMTMTPCQNICYIIYHYKDHTIKYAQLNHFEQENQASEKNASIIDNNFSSSRITEQLQIYVRGLTLHKTFLATISLASIILQNVPKVCNEKG